MPETKKVSDFIEEQGYDDLIVNFCKSVENIDGSKSVTLNVSAKAMKRFFCKVATRGVILKKAKTIPETAKLLNAPKNPALRELDAWRTWLKAVNESEPEL